MDDLRRGFVRAAKAGLLLLSSVTLLPWGCSRGDAGGDNWNAGVRIKGNIPRNGEARAFKDGTFSLSDAAKVLVFSPSTMSHGLFSAFFDIVDGSFTAEALPGTAAVMIFLTDDYQYIGNLHVNELNVLPLGNLSDGETTVIDLASLTQDGSLIIPSHDPFGEEILISEAEAQVLREVGAFYESLAKNLDTDNDGVNDFLDHSQMVVTSIYWLSVGTWGVNETPPTSFDASNFYLNISMKVQGGANIVVSSAEDVVLDGPLDDPYPDIWTEHVLIDPPADQGFLATFSRPTAPTPGSPLGMANLPFKKGIYRLTLGASEVRTFEFFNVAAEHNLVIVSPILITNAEDQITSVSLEYQLPSGEAVNPASMLGGVSIQMIDSANQDIDSPGPMLGPDRGWHTWVPSSPFERSRVSIINVAYDDMLGNEYVIRWVEWEQALGL